MPAEAVPDASKNTGGHYRHFFIGGSPFFCSVGAEIDETSPQMQKESFRNPPGEVPQTTFGAVWGSFCLRDIKKVTLPFQIWDSLNDSAIFGTLFLHMGGPR